MNRRQHLSRMSNGQGDGLAGDPVVGKPLLEPTLQPVRSVDCDLALADKPMDFRDRDGGQMKGIIGVTHRSHRRGGQFGLIVDQSEIGAGVKDVIHGVRARAQVNGGAVTDRRGHPTPLAAADERAPPVRRSRWNQSSQGGG